MRKLVAVGMFVAAGCGGAAAREASPPATEPPAARAAADEGEESDPNPPWLRELAPRRILYSVPGMDAAVPRKDIAYKQVDGAELTMDLWAPAGGGARRPVIVFIHGGPVPPKLAITPKDWGVFVSYGQLAAASGFAGVTFNHRLHSPGQFADSQQDVMDLIAYLRDHAGELGIDADRMCLWGFSGGGALLSAGMREGAPKVRCLVSYYGVLDRRPQRAEVPASITDQTLADLSPVHHVTAGRRIPPMLIARAGKDAPAINQTVDAFIREARTRKAPVQVIEHADGQHGFDILDDVPRTGEVIAETMRFVSAQLKAP